MRRLFVIDLKDYNPNSEKYYRPSARGIIFDANHNIAMIYSNKYHYYKFPGGGVEEGESYLETLAREIKEETGMTLIPDSVQEFGETLKIQRGDEAGENVIHIQQSFYYLCKVEDKIGTQNLDDGEKDSEFVLKFIPIDEAIRTNAAFASDNSFRTQIAEREKRVLEIIKTEIPH